MTQENKGRLFVCATPIGNLEDITLRVVRVLRECDVVYAEDTRHTLKLLNHYEIKKPLVSCHEHNERERAKEAIGRVLSGENVAYVTDAGMPGISDPGAAMIKCAIDAGAPFDVCPGASAAITAAVLCGLDTREFLFVGFLPREDAKRRAKLMELSRNTTTMIFYESPLRIAKTVEEIYAHFGERDAALMRELTKIHETTYRMKLSDLSKMLADSPVRGECVLAVAGDSAVDSDDSVDKTATAKALLEHLMQNGVKLKDAVKQVSIVTDITRNDAYRLALELEGE